MDVLTRQEVSELFKLPLSTVDYFVGTNQIPYSRLGKRSVRFSRSELEHWFESRKYQRPNYERRSRQPRDGDGRFK
jgi:excisionase family DNA binding protein